MKLAVISPINLLQHVQGIHDLHYHMVLTHYYRSSPEYRAFYKARDKADWIIQDNDAAELKTGTDDNAIIEVAEDLRPSIVIAPDVIYDGSETLKRTNAFLDAYSALLSKQGTKVMAVPQGTTPREWHFCFQQFNWDDRIQWLGISMFYTPKYNGRRAEVLESISRSVTKPCHLLGLWDNPYDLRNEKQYSFVKGVDSAKPIEFAFEGLSLGDWAKHKHIDDDWYFETVGADFGEDPDTLLGRIHDNIQEMKRIVL